MTANSPQAASQAPRPAAGSSGLPAQPNILMIGQYPSTNRVYDNAALFAADIPSIGHYLTNASYDCILSGKMHFVGADQLHGFRRRLTTDIYAEEFGMLQNRAPWSVARDPSLFEEEKGRGRHAGNYVGSNVPVG